jgi:glycosyltransferase involved in cell wall biosynthesis
MLEGGKLRLSLGLLAHNEEQGIRQMLESLFEQSIFSDAGRRRLGLEYVELVCVPNGCTDRTAEVVSEIFQARSPSEAMALFVEPCAEAGKARSWNAYVHEFSDTRADYLILLDADIIFAFDDVLERLVACLKDEPAALVSTDTPVKRTKLKTGSLSFTDRASLSASELPIGKNAICGQLYCARASELRRIWMPAALPVEDGFLAAMIYTDGFTVKQRPGAIRRLEDVVHYYDTYEGLAGFLRHERRIVVGSVINSWIFSLLWEEGARGHVGRFIQRKNSSDPTWLDELIALELTKRGMWVVPPIFVFKRLHGLRSRHTVAILKHLPIALIGTALQFIACLLANRTLRRSQASRFW